MIARMRCVIALLVLSVSSVAYAQVYDDPETEEALKSLDPNSQPPPPPPPDTSTEAERQPPVDAVRPPPKAKITLPKGGVSATFTVESSLSKGAATEPTSLALDASYGLLEKLTLSIITSGAGTTGFRGSAGSGFCVTGTEKGCAKVFNNVGVEMISDFSQGNLAFGGVFGVYALSLDPSFIDLKAGFQSSYRAGKLIAAFNPSVFVGVTKRDEGNKGIVFLPASIGVQATPEFFAALGGGVAGPIDKLGDAWTARLGVVLRYRVAKGTFFATSFFFPKLAGGDAVMGTGADARFAQFWVTIVR